MICDYCREKPANVFVEMHEMRGTEVKRTISLCEDCAKMFGVNQDMKAFNLLFNAFIKNSSPVINFNSESPDLNKEKKPVDTACPVCATTLFNIKKTKRVGCPECYSVFKDNIKEIQKQNGSTGAYTGTLPPRLASFKSVLTDRMVLRELLEDSLQKEEYEKAAFYRDYLTALERSPVSKSNDDE